MLKIEQFFNGIGQILDNNTNLVLLSIYVSLLLYFYLLMMNNKQNLENKEITSSIFYTYLVFFVFSTFFLFFVLFKIFTSESLDNYLIILNSEIIKIISATIFIYLLYVSFKIFSSTNIKIRKIRAKQDKDFDFEIVEKKENTITKEMINDIKPFYNYIDNKKTYQDNYKVFKFTKLENDEITNFQYKLLDYLLKLTKEKTLKEKFLEFEILRLVQITIDNQIDLKIGQFRSLVEQEKDNEILGAIYNLREHNVTMEGYSYFIQYVKTMKVRKEQYE